MTQYTAGHYRDTDHTPALITRLAVEVYFARVAVEVYFLITTISTDTDNDQLMVSPYQYSLQQKQCSVSHLGH